jgi:hypothetical protein
MKINKTSLMIVPAFISAQDCKKIIYLALESEDRFNLEITEEGRQVSTANNTVGNMGWKEAATKLRNGSTYYIPSFSYDPNPSNSNGFTINYREDTSLWALTDKHVESASEYLKSIFNIQELKLMATILRRGGVGASMPPHQDGPVLNGEELVDIDFSCFIYLNDDFEGGSIFFEELGVSWQPVAGSAIFLSNTSTKSMVHEIKTVARGNRFSINAFFRVI